MVSYRMIKNLLEYQEKDKKRIEIVQSIEGGRIKREIDAANRMVTEAKATLLSLENDAQSLTNAYENAKKTAADVLASVEKLTKQKATSEDELQEITSQMNVFVQRLGMIESQLENIAKSIAAKTKLFEDTKNQVIKSQTSIKNLTPSYEAQLAQVQPKIDEVEKELAKIAATIDKTLLEKYKARRKSEQSGKIVDIAVPLSAGRCGGCYFELPLSLTHSISVNGYIICEECGKIIHGA